MIITSVRVHQLVSGPGFSNYAVDAEAVVKEGDDPAAVLKELQAWVEGQLSAKVEMDRLYSDRDRLRWDVRNLERQRESIQTEINRRSQIIAGHDRLRELAIKEGIVTEGQELALTEPPF